MDGRQQSDLQPDDDKDLNDAEVIDLTQIVEGGDDDDIIDLNDILEQPDQSADAAHETEEEVISLVDAIPAQEKADLAEAMDDEIIDLMDVTAVEAPEQDAVVSPSIDEAEEVIDLLDAVEPQAANAEAKVDQDAQSTDLEHRAEVVLADTTDADAESSNLDRFDSDSPEEAAQTAGPDEDFMALKDDQAITDEDEAPAMDDNLTDALADIPEPVAAGIPDNIEPAATEAAAETLAEVPFVPLPPPGSAAAEPVPLTERQVEDALERVIEKIYGEKIEQMMIQTIEKTVKREIEKIKNALLEDS